MLAASLPPPSELEGGKLFLKLVRLILSLQYATVLLVAGGMADCISMVSSSKDVQSIPRVFPLCHLLPS